MTYYVEESVETGKLVEYIRNEYFNMPICI